MALSTSQYNHIMRSYEETRIHNQHVLDERTDYIFTHVDGYEDLSKSISSISIECGKKLLSGDQSALASLHTRLDELILQKKELLVKNGYSADYLEPIYTCPDCKDTGYIRLEDKSEEKCHCFKQATITLLYDQSNIRDMLSTENFDNISYEYYQGEDLNRFNGAVTTCQSFIKNFNSDYHNLFFYGTVGTGKSFLSGCVAKALLDKGHPVLYFSAIALVDHLSKMNFDYNLKSDLNAFYDDLFHCDLLIIDDLGTELTNNFVTSQLFLCLNERHLRKKATVISTNLSLEELRDRYSDRIFSRITSNYELCKLSGPDIRMYKKRMLSRK